MKYRINSFSRRLSVWMLFLNALTGSDQLSAQDSQWRGPNRDGKYMDTGLLEVLARKGS